MKSFMKESDTSAPVPHGPYEYYRRTVESKSYKIHCRRPKNMEYRDDLEAAKPLDVEAVSAEAAKLIAEMQADGGKLPDDKALHVDGFYDPSFEVTGEDEEILLDENEEAKAHAHYVVGCVAISPSHQLMAYTVDTSGYETYDLRIVRLDTAKKANHELVDEIKNIDGHVTWGKDDDTIFYCKLDDAHRPYQVYRHTVAESADDDDVKLFEESDERHWVDLSKTRSGRFIVISSDSPETSEAHVIDLDDNNGTPTPRVIAAREHGCRYTLDHRGSLFYLVANRSANKTKEYLESTLCTLPVSAVLDGSAKEKGRTLWREVPSFPYEGEKDPERPERPIRMLESVSCFQTFLALSGRRDGYAAVWVLRPKSAPQGEHEEATPDFHVHQVFFQEPGSTVLEGPNRDYESKMLRVCHESMRMPSRDLDLDTRAEHLPLFVVKQQEVPGGYDQKDYRTASVAVPPEVRSTCFDGDEVEANSPPVRMTLMWKADMYEGEAIPKNAPVLLYAYGAYGVCIDPEFDFKRLPLLNRGFVYAIAHVRGGGEEGRNWYEGATGAKYLTKKRTFLDLVECARYLKREGICAPDKLCVEGRSAGGLTVGAALNLDPGVFDCAIAGVPFVDIMTTMCDSTIPLTVTEWEEWGNPNETAFHDYMCSYSPIDNVRGEKYPPMLCTSGLHDPRVAYWEPLKWVTTLRDTASGGPFLSKCDLESGHFSASDRYRYLRERAYELAFVISVISNK